MKKLLLLSFIVSFSLCISCQTVATKTNRVFSETEWEFIEVNGEKISAENETKPFLHFSNFSLSGSAGCNHLIGEIQLGENNKISFQNVGSTRRLCQNMDTEQAIIIALSDVNKYLCRNNFLYLKKDNKTIILLKKK